MRIYTLTINFIINEVPVKSKFVQIDFERRYYASLLLNSTSTTVI